MNRKIEAIIVDLDEANYESALSTCCSYMCQTPGEEFKKVQKILIKYLFGESHLRSLFASDLYAFAFRVIRPDVKRAMYQIIVNMCEAAPKEAAVKGTALINRLEGL